jgi:hypothetical protein
MGYRIAYAIGGRTMRAEVRGRSSHAASIGREIAEEAGRASVEHLLIDVRGLVDRLGALGTLVATAAGKRRVAVVDSPDNELYHPFSEHAARRRGAELRYFYDTREALTWLTAAAACARG